MINDDWCNNYVLNQSTADKIFYWQKIKRRYEGDKKSMKMANHEHPFCPFHSNSGL